jgi:hypothetical protein
VRTNRWRIRRCLVCTIPARHLVTSQRAPSTQNGAEVFRMILLLSLMRLTPLFDLSSLLNSSFLCNSLLAISSLAARSNLLL